MKTNLIQLRHKMNEVYAVEPNDLGIPSLTFLYRRINVYFKKMPFIFVIPLSFIGAVVCYFMFGYLIVRFVSLLQYGF